LGSKEFWFHFQGRHAYLKITNMYFYKIFNLIEHAKYSESPQFP
jgi:hypothetical protein